MYQRCPLCDKLLCEVTPGHAKMHGMTKLEFLEKYPNFRSGQFEYGAKFKNPVSESINTIDRKRRRRRGY